MAVSQTLKFACNIGTMFPQSTSLINRLQKATSCGFNALEVAFPYSWSLDEWQEALTAHPMQVVLINTPLGVNKEPGLASCQNKLTEFMAGVQQGVEYCTALKCSQLHIMAGNEPPYEGQRQIFIHNMRQASDILKKHGIVGLIETISPGTIPGYFLNDPRETLMLVQDICVPNIAFQFDVFHLSMLGETDEQIADLFDGCNLHFIKHVQVAQTPKRNEVNAEGGVDYRKIFKHMISRRYSGYVGLEYTPQDSSDRPCSEETLKFLSEF
ncbi:putative hydroxypyruvate isomerase [Bolinopsis microptera]|uniref:putative hydroxypyruvate isomerase n=1 Tax=Bolinopsis microptera TaxID=2820187 RepID=UPI003079DC58